MSDIATKNSGETTLATVDDIRYANFLRAFAQWEADNPQNAGHGSIRAFGEAVGISERQIGHLRSRHRGIGNSTARKLETALSLPVGWMDNRHTTETGEPVAVIAGTTIQSGSMDRSEEQAMLLLRGALRINRAVALREIERLFAATLEEAAKNDGASTAWAENRTQQPKNVHSGEAVEQSTQTKR